MGYGLKVQAFETGCGKDAEFKSKEEIWRGEKWCRSGNIYGLEAVVNKSGIR